MISELFWQTTINPSWSDPESRLREKRGLFTTACVVIDPDGRIALDYRYYRRSQYDPDMKATETGKGDPGCATTIAWDGLAGMCRKA